MAGDVHVAELGALRYSRQPGLDSQEVNVQFSSDITGDFFLVPSRRLYLSISDVWKHIKHLEKQRCCQNQAKGPHKPCSPTQLTHLRTSTYVLAWAVQTSQCSLSATFSPITLRPFIGAYRLPTSSSYPHTSSYPPLPRCARGTVDHQEPNKRHLWPTLSGIR